MIKAGAAVGKVLTGFRYKLPVIAIGMQCEHQHTKDTCVTNIIVRCYVHDFCKLISSCPNMNEEFRALGRKYHPPFGVQKARSMVMRFQNQIGIMLIELRPE
jgi:hypothetical protein